MGPDRAASPKAADDWFLWPFARSRTVVILFILVVIALVFFRNYPQVDLAVSRYFFTQVPCPEGPLVCGSFEAAHSTVLNGLRDMFHILPPSVAVALAIGILARQRRDAGPSDGFSAGAAAAIASLALASVVIVNVALKDVWGRPRPINTDLFGGNLPFVPAGKFSRYCVDNCSFVSGEASAGFWLLAVAALTPPRWRIVALVAALVSAIVIAALRVSFGAHYLSDVVLAGLITLLIFSILAWTARH